MTEVIKLSSSLSCASIPEPYPNSCLFLLAQVANYGMGGQYEEHVDYGVSHGLTFNHCSSSFAACVYGPDCTKSSCSLEYFLGLRYSACRRSSRKPHRNSSYICKSSI